MPPETPVFGAGFCWGGIQHIQTKMTQTSKKMFIVVSCYITKIAFEQSKMPWPKVKCESLCSYHQKSNQEGEQRCMPCSVLLAHVNKQMFSRINTGLKILTFHQQPNIVCLYYPQKKSSDQSLPQISLLRSHTFPRTFEGIGSPKGFCRDNWRMSAIGVILCLCLCVCVVFLVST